AHFVGMTFRHRLAGEEVICPRQFALLSKREGRAADKARPVLTTPAPEVKPPRARLGKYSARAQGPHQVDDRLAYLGIADLDEGAVQLEAFAAVQKFEDEGFRFRLGHSP